ncbi:MAG: MTAP family purine nucleoside phosphorylase, partial [Candidatus Thermoplasmatota archaeon]|nr:MTAP family purine nucleoside phosphorylase [Candidatus Thermoplasmatota archaeon]
MIAIISGTAFVSLKNKCEKITVETPYGQVELLRTKLSGKDVYFLQRHGNGMKVPPHLVNYCANIWALKAAKVDKIISVFAVGSLKQKIEPGDYAVVDDFVDLTKSRAPTFFEKEKVHIDVSEPYDPKIRMALLSACKNAGAKAHDGGVYVCTEGPRFETKVEIRMMAQFGDVVGMTGVPEVVLANELKIPYGALAFSTNYACGIKGALDGDEIDRICAGKAKEIQ